MAPFGLTDVHIRGFRSLKDTSFRPGAISAIVGEPSTGKSNLLTAIWALLDPDAAPLSAADVAHDEQGPIRIVGELADDSSISVGGDPPVGSSAVGSTRPPALFFPAGLRDGALVAPGRTSRGGGATDRRGSDGRIAADRDRGVVGELPDDPDGSLFVVCDVGGREPDPGAPRSR